MTIHIKTVVRPRLFGGFTITAFAGIKGSPRLTYKRGLVNVDDHKRIARRWFYYFADIEDPPFQTTEFSPTEYSHILTCNSH